MTKLQVFDPPMCCTSGVCGTNVDTKLVGFLNDIEWLKKQGIEVERHGLAFEPAAFATNEVVKQALQQDGNDCLPLVLANDKIVYRGSYPDRKKLAEICEIEWKEEFASQEAVTASVADSSSVCGPDCDCHQTDVSNKSKKIIFVSVLVIIVAILVFKSFCKAEATEFKITKAKNAISLVSNKTSFGKPLDSVGQLNLTASGLDTAFIYIPAKNNASISKSSNSAVLKAKKALEAKNIKVGLYTLSTSSADYASVSSQATPPAFLVVYKNGGKIPVSGEINDTKLLQAYIAATRYCGSSCPCH